ncbi:hypothetical protein F5141DRAFT_1062492 [Pisolithus sp. B1]|nr:hypothetical protein F5141DRAFT_1062492 [Pisolithus sp. B1]
MERHGRKCKRAEEMDIPNKVTWIAEQLGELDEVHDASPYAPGFLEVPSPEELKKIYGKFFEVTSNDALATRTCGVFTPTAPTQEGHVAGTKHHPSNCQCLGELWKARDKPPRYSLANQLWMVDNDELKVSGMVDTEMSSITAWEMIAWGLSNLWEEGREGAYAVRHGDWPVSDFGRVQKNSKDLGGDGSENEINFFEQAYPSLFPYGEEGIERQQEVHVDFADHIRWTLHYHDHRFWRHETFPFVCFGRLQR